MRFGMSLVNYEELEGRVGKITLNDPDNLNAMSEAMADEFAQVVATIDKKKEKLRAVILTGAGRAFSAGGHLEMLEKKRSIPGEQNRLLMLKFYHSFLDIRALGIPLIAALNGHAVGAGLCLATACDIRIAGEKSKLGFTFAKLGLHPGMGATYFLPRVIGPAAATELLITGRVIEVDEALRIGLVSRVVPADTVLSVAIETAREIAECGPEAVRQVLESLRFPASSLDSALQREAVCQGINYASPEFKEGLQATKEKRKAVF